MTVYIDSNTFAANPALYADAEKTKPLPRVLPAVQLREGKLNVAFLGDRAPTNEMVLSLSAVLAGTQTQILAEYGDPVDGADVPTWEFPFALNSQALADVLADKQRATLLVGVIATAEGYRREWQILVTCDPTATGEFDPEQIESAKTFADAAKRSADNAAESESNAALFATDSAKSATASAQSASASATSASNAKASEDNAKASEDNAATSATNASQSASAAAQSKTDAQSSASSAAQSASNASNSASSANTSAGNASNSATAAATSANNASASASAAKASEDNAKASETASKASETASANSASSASTSATNASNSASSASTSATNAGNSATAAAESAEQAAQSAEQAEDTLQNVSNSFSDAWQRINQMGEIIWFTLTIPEDDGTSEYWMTDDGTHANDSNPPTYARYYDFKGWLFSATSGGVATVDWGDGSVEEISWTANQNICHKYTLAGRYNFFAKGDIWKFGSAETFSVNSDMLARLKDVNAVFHACTLPTASIGGIMHGAYPAPEVFVVQKASQYGGWTLGMRNPDYRCVAYVDYRRNGDNIYGMHNLVFDEVRIMFREAVKEYSFWNVSKTPSTVRIYAPKKTNMGTTYFGPQVSTIDIDAPLIEKANGKTYNSCYGCNRLVEFVRGLPSLKYAKNAFYETRLNADSVIRILKALPDLSADTEHLPDNTLATSDSYYGYRIITFESTTAGAAVLAPTAEMWAAYDEAVAKGWLVEGFKGTHP